MRASSRVARSRRSARSILLTRRGQSSIRFRALQTQSADSPDLSQLITGRQGVCVNVCISRVMVGNGVPPRCNTGSPASDAPVLALRGTPSGAFQPRLSRWTGRRLLPTGGGIRPSAHVPRCHCTMHGHSCHCTTGPCCGHARARRSTARHVALATAKHHPRSAPPAIALRMGASRAHAVSAAATRCQRRAS